MDIMVTLPSGLMDKIVNGEKKVEMRRWLPRRFSIGSSKMVAVEKGCGSRVLLLSLSEVSRLRSEDEGWGMYGSDLGVNREFHQAYWGERRLMFYYRILEFDVKDKTWLRKMIGDFRNPQAFVYIKVSL